jgi:hypothetical protein
MQAALRGYYCGAHDEGQTHVHAAQAEGGYRISAADYLDCLVEMTLAEMQDAVQAESLATEGVDPAQPEADLREALRAHQGC